MMRSTSLQRRLEAETVRHAGSLARLHFYHGTMPLRCELAADGERVEGIPATEAMVRDLAQGNAPLMAKGADYWRLLDNNGNVVMQGRRPMANPPSVQALGGSIGRPRGPAGGPGTRIGTMGPGSRFDAQGMITAANFTDGDGNLMAVSFRFLNSVFDCIRYLEADMTQMETGQAVAALPAAASNQGTRTFVTDSNTTIFYDIVAGGGTSFVPVFSDGSNWRVG